MCGGDRLRPYAMDPWSAEALHFAQARCLGCGLLIAQPQAADAEIETYYGRRYYEERWPDPGAVLASNADMCRHHELPLMRRLWAGWPPPGDAELVEVGCGYGAMLEVLRGAGYRVRGCDPSGKAVDVCLRQGLDVVQGGAPGLPLPRQAFDISMARHVIEHLTDPRALVKEMVDLVRPGGVVAIVTEDAWTSQYAWDRAAAFVRGRLPAFRTSTDHTYVFRAVHLRRLLSEAGCDQVRTRSFTYRPERESLHWRAYKGLFRILDRALGHGDFLIAVGHRPAAA